MIYTKAQAVWLLERASPPLSVGPRSLMVCGEGPIPYHEWRSELSRLRRGHYDIDQNLSALLIGRENWSPEALRRLVEARRGLALRVYTHEMFLSFLLTQNDPLNGLPDDVRRLWGKHPALQFLDDEGLFNWPELNIPFSATSFDQDGFSAIGVLSVFEYHVGNSGERASLRRAALSNACTEAMPAHVSRELRDYCGSPGSLRRLQIVASAIARQFHLTAGRVDNVSAALQHWESDFAWLKRTFYDTRSDVQFDWPAIIVST
jgi:hypothetical protein